MRTFVRQARGWLPVVLVLSLFGAYTIDSRGPHALIVEMRSEAAGNAQLFYDLGDGFNEADSVTVNVPVSSGYSELRFTLPSFRIRQLRLDPISTRGAFSIRRVYIVDGAQRLLKQFAAADLLPANEIATRSEEGSEVAFATTATATDPFLQLGHFDPAATEWLNETTFSRLLLPAIMALLATAAVAAAAFAALQIGWLERLLDRVGSGLSDAPFVVVDRFAAAWCVAGAVIFVVLVSAGLHGSSMSLYAGLSRGPDLQPLLGTPRPIRSDEWAVHTPAILNQVYRAQPFEVAASAVGPDGASLIANLPVRHFTTLFRPQFWGFFVLPPAYGFAFYWQFKAILLLGGVFALLLLLTQSSRIAAFGALWYATSSYVQWTYSWPSLLPEMVGLFGLVMASLFYMSVGRRVPLLAGAAVVCVASAINFALCAYIPHQIPLVWLGVFLCGWWLWSNRPSIFRRDAATPRVVALGVTALSIVIVMLAFYRDAEPTVMAAANTDYPGQRILFGGAFPISMFFSHFFAFWTNDRVFPLRELLGNICEASGFFWLAPISTLAVARACGPSRQQRAYLVLALFGVLLFVWLTIPLPAIAGSLTLMNKSGGGRSMHVLGLVNVALVAVALSLAPAAGRGGWRRTLLLTAAVFAMLYPVMLLGNAALAQFLSASRVVIVAAYFSLVIVALTEGRLPALATLLIVPQLAIFGFVNPLDRGLHVIEESPLFKFVQTRPELLRARWIVYADSFTYADFFSAVGCEVLTGLRYLPDVKTLYAFELSPEEKVTINRAGLLIARPAYGAAKARFEQLAVHTVMWHVNPLDAHLPQVGVRYAAFTSPPPADVAARMRLLSQTPVSGFWLYELP